MIKLSKPILIIAFILVLSLLTSCTGNAQEQTFREAAETVNEAIGEKTTGYESVNEISDEITEQSNNVIIDISTFSIQPTFTRPYLPLSLQYAAESSINNRRYLLPTDDEYKNTRFINHIEETIYLIESVVFIQNLRRTIDIPFFDYEEDDVFVQTLNTLTGRRLPFWLSIGIESFAKNNISQSNTGQNNITLSDITENFGDLSFLPSLWGTDEHKTAVSTAENFVEFLFTNDLLDELVSMYVENNIQTANETARTHFQSFAGKPMSDLNFRLELRDRSGYYIMQSTQWGNFTFVFYTFEQYLPANTMQRHIDYIGRATEFVIEWYSEYIDFIFMPINHRVYYREFVHDPHSSDRWAAVANIVPNTIIYGGNNLFFPHIAVHEISHVIEGRINSVIFRPFSEGLAYLLMYSFEGSTAPRLHSHRAAINMLNAGTYANPYESDMGAGYPMSYILRYPELSMRTTATSFVQYLIETYGAEKYLQVHWRVGNFENVYGVAVEEMILRWREFLREYSAS